MYCNKESDCDLHIIFRWDDVFDIDYILYICLCTYFEDESLATGKIFHVKPGPLKRTAVGLVIVEKLRQIDDIFYFSFSFDEV